MVPAGTVFLLARGMTLLNDVPICVANWPMSFNQDVKALRPNQQICEDFLPYLLLGNKERLLSLVDLAGHGTGRLNSDELRAFDVLLPPLSDRRAIAEILGALDDKIELNRRMNETLETMARALFKSWFVDFDPVRAKAEGRDPGLPKRITDLFPDRFGADGIPAGWRWEALFAHARLISGGTPKTEIAEYWDGDILWASAKDVSQCPDPFLTKTERTITDRGLDESATRFIPKLSTVVVARGATTGRFRLFGRDMAMNQTCYALQSRNKRPFWLAAAFAGLVDELVHAAHGSVFDTITTKTLESARAIVGDYRLTDVFEATVCPLYRRLLVNCEQSRTLAALSDMLLPKLISGELRAREAERAVAEAAG